VQAPRREAQNMLEVPVSGVVAEARHLGDVFHVLPVQHVGLAERLGISIDASPSLDGETEFLDRGPKCDLKSSSSQYDRGGRDNSVVSIQSPDRFVGIGWRRAEEGKR